MIDFVVVVLSDDFPDFHLGHYEMIADHMCNVFYFLHLNESSIGVYLDRVALRNSIKLMLCDC